MSKAENVRILVVDDSFFMRKVICDILKTDPRITIAGQAGNGEEALQKISELRPDVVTLDIVMPKLSGLEVLRQLQQMDYTPTVVIVSAHSREAALTTLDCLAAGATDFVLKPSGSDAWQLHNTAADLLAKIDTAITVHARDSSHQTNPTLGKTAPITQQTTSPEYKAVVIGASTGGPMALEQILPRLPATVDCPIVVAQHMPPAFVTALSERLNTKCNVSVTVAKNGQPLHPGVVYFCQGGATTRIIDLHGPVFQVESSTATLTPSIDTLLISASEYYADSLIAIILTGMGEDGLRGAKAIRERGGTVIVQDAASSAVFGMGKAVEKAGLANDVLPLHDIMPWLTPRLPVRTELSQ